MCKAGKKSITPVEFACGLTEFALLGVLAQRRYKTPGGARAAWERPEAKVLLWDSKTMRFINDEAATSLVDPPYRKEWDYKA